MALISSSGVVSGRQDQLHGVTTERLCLCEPVKCSTGSGAHLESGDVLLRQLICRSVGAAGGTDRPRHLVQAPRRRLCPPEDGLGFTCLTCSQCAQRCLSVGVSFLALRARGLSIHPWAHRCAFRCR